MRVRRRGKVLKRMGAAQTQFERRIRYIRFNYRQ